jgi:hypothetical protein
VDEGLINSGSRTITLTQADNATPLVSGDYSDCTVAVTDDAGNASNVLSLSPFVVDLQAPGVNTKSTLNLEVGDTDVPISPGNLLVSDNFSGPSGITFTVTSPPVHGTLSGGNAFTQADINAGLVTYDHDGSANFSDSFVFKVEDEAGNVNSNTTFNINIAPARIKPIAFLFNFSADAPSEAQANGCVRLRGAAIEVPFAFEGLLPVPSAEILDLSVVVTGASAGNGTFGLDDFDAIAWDSNGGELNFDLDLVGQSTDGDPWGTVVEESAGDFNLFGLNPDAPTGVFYFTLAADNGNADSMELTSMIRSDSEYCDALFSSSFEPNIAPTVPVTVVVDIARPDTTQDLTCLASGSTDPDSPFVVYEYQWYIDNIPADNRMTLDSSFTQRGQVARCEARANDLEGGISQWISSISVEIFNSPPAAPQVNLLPESPDSLTDLDCIISTSSTDADGDFLTYDYQWFGDDSLIGASTNTLDAILTAPGMTVRCEARAFDGFDSSEWARSPDRVIMPQ